MGRTLGIFGVRPLALALPLFLATPPEAHEYWIAPEEFTPEPGEKVDARLLVGQMMEGAELPWLSHQVSSFAVSSGGDARTIEGQEGDLPAASFVPEDPGLHIITHETHPLTVTFDTFEDFVEYLNYEGLGAVGEQHRTRGLPLTGISEAYSRSAKALVQVGPVRAEDQDRPLGLALELVALDNPYSGVEVLPVALLWQGRPLAGRQISVFREKGGVERTLVTTDAEGHTEIPLKGGGRFVLNAVHIEPADAGTHPWVSTWGSLSFEAIPPQ